MLFALGRTITIADAVSKIKSTSSLWMNQRGLQTAFHWQGGYAVFSVSQSNVEAVREYIRRQPHPKTARILENFKSPQRMSDNRIN